MALGDKNPPAFATLFELMTHGEIPLCPSGSTVKKMDPDVKLQRSPKEASAAGDVCSSTFDPLSKVGTDVQMCTKGAGPSQPASKRSQHLVV